ncbi:patatin family protein [Breznakia sp. OttesenSCG-928-G09]|nr:patatin family protein [Breznakia sp. OttesenSCG-928-G09]
MYKSSLLLEGGGMRGVYTAGVLDFLLEKQIEFETVIGVSAGSCHGCNYLSKQIGRNFQINTDYLDGSDYLSFRNLIKTKSAFGMDFMFDDIPNKLNLFDYEAYHNNKAQLIAVSSDVETGLPVYRNIVNMYTDIDYLKASISIPLLAPIVEVDGRKLLDGGIADSIPLRYAESLGYEKHVLILTRDPAYRKGKNRLMPLIRKQFKKYPNFVKAVEERHLNYNNTLNYIELMKRQKKVFVIQPQSEVKISQLEKNKQKLRSLYEQGYQDAKDSYDDLLSFFK